MEMGDRLKRQDRPTMLQLSYLMELEHTSKKRGAQGMIAAKCGVNASTVNRYFKQCTEKGYLNEGLEFTPQGREWFDRYQKLILRLQTYFQEIGSKKEEAEEAVKSLIENTDPYIIELMLANYEKQQAVKLKKKEVLYHGIRDTFRHCRNHRVKYGIYKLNRASAKESFSMAMRGFLPEAFVIQKDAKDYLELHLKNMEAASRLNGELMSGRLDTLKYEYEEHLVAAEMTEDGRLYLPLDACQIHNWQDGSISGKVAITVTCSVGRVHMPESAALLMFWV